MTKTLHPITHHKHQMTGHAAQKQPSTAQQMGDLSSLALRAGNPQHSTALAQGERGVHQKLTEHPKTQLFHWRRSVASSGGLSRYAVIQHGRKGHGIYRGTQRKGTSPKTRCRCQRRRINPLPNGTTTVSRTRNCSLHGEHSTSQHSVIHDGSCQDCSGQDRPADDRPSYATPEFKKKAQPSVANQVPHTHLA